MAEDRARNGVTMKLYASGSFVSAPQKDTAFPASGLLQSVVTGTANGGDGSYRYTGVAGNATYYCGGTFNGSIVWDSFTVGLDSNQSTVKSYGAVGDGSTDDTTAVQAALDDATVGRIIFPPGSYALGNVNVNSRQNLIIEGQGALIIWQGTAAAGDQIGLRLKGTNSNITVRNLEFTSLSGTASDGHAGVWWKNTDSVQQIRIENNWFRTLARGVAGTRTASGTWADIKITGNFFDQLTGTSTSQGEGVCLTTNSTTAMNAEISGNTFSSGSLYDVHLSQGVGAIVKGNKFLNHRISTVTGTLSAAVRVNRFRDVVIEGNYFNSTNDGAIELTPTSGTTTRNIVIRGNTITDSANAVEDVTIGGTGTQGAPEEIVFQGNQVYKSGKNAAAVKVNAGKRVRIDGNQFSVLAITTTVPTLSLEGTNDSGGTAAYSDEIEITDNLFYGTIGGGGVSLGIYLQAAFCTSTARLSLRNNRQTAGLSGVATSAASVTNPNIRLVGTSAGLISTTYDTETFGPVLISGQAQITGRLLATAGVKLQAAVVKTSNYTITNADFMVIADTTSGSVTLTLPAANTGGVFAVKKAPSALNTMTISPNGADTIDGGASLSVAGGTTNSGWLLISDALTKWYVIANLA